MTNSTRFSILAACAVLLASCGPKNEKDAAEKAASKYESPKEIATAMASEMETLMTSTSSVTDAASAKKVAAKMDSLATDMNALAAELSKMDKPSPETRKEISDDMDKRMEESMKNMTPPKPEDIKVEEATQIMEIMEAAQKKFETDTLEAKKTFEAYFKPEESKDGEPAPVE